MIEEIALPEGWTYFAHRTNTERWQTDPFSQDSITVNKLMSVVTERDVYQELRHYGKNHFQSYNTGNGVPFEIRCLICDLPTVRSMPDDNELKGIMYNQFYFDKMNFGGCYGQRHHSIPKGEELVVVGIGNHDEVFDKECKIIWTIPRRFAKQYMRDYQTKTSRMIEMNAPQDEKNNQI